MLCCLSASALVAPRIDEELSKYASQALSNSTPSDAIALYEKAYADPRAREFFRAASLYQIALIYLSERNPGHNTEQARSYLTRITDEFPSSEFAAKAEEFLRELE